MLVCSFADAKGTTPRVCFSGNVCTRPENLATYAQWRMRLTLSNLLAPAGRASEHAEIKAVADHIIRFAGDNDAIEAARGFIEYWVGRGDCDATNDGRGKRLPRE